MYSFFRCAPFCGVLFMLLAISALPAAAITIDTVFVGNPGNAPDPYNTQRGSVPYSYRMGTTEVTNDQYAAFLNAKAQVDVLHLYNSEMAGSLWSGIVRSGSNGNWVYSSKPNMGNKPVNFVNWYDAIRFANWLGNGQGDSDTETGSYTLGEVDANGIPNSDTTITRNFGATWVIPTEDEWYKAAYHQPEADGGPLNDYWRYAATSNEAPTQATANSVGDIANPGPNVVNWNSGADWNGVDGNFTTVGSAGPESRSYYGTYDQDGNVMEWNEDLRVDELRQYRGSFHLSNSPGAIGSTSAGVAQPAAHYTSMGFRVAVVPEPSALVLAGIGAVGLLAGGLRKRRTIH